MATKTVINISPKVFTGLLTGLGLAAAGGVTAAVTPHTFDFLGPWGPAAFSVVIVLLAQLAAWFKHEQAAQAAAEAKSAEVVSAPAAAANAHPAVTAPVGWVGDVPAVEPLVPPTADQIINGTPVAPTDDLAAHSAATAPTA